MIPLVIEASKLAIAAIILWYVCEALAMPATPKLVVQSLIVLVAVLAVLGMALAGATPLDHYLAFPGVPSIVR